MTGLSAAQQATVLKLLNKQGCPCGCGMDVADCRVKDPNCYYSRGLAAVIVAAIKDGKSEKDALALADASQFAHAPQQDGRVLEDPVAIPVAGAPVTGPQNAAVTLVEFSDFQCPYCTLAVPQIHALMKAYPSAVKLIFKEYPLDTHPQAAMAAAAAVGAQKQGKFWQMHDALFAQDGHLSRETILGAALELGLDMKRFQDDWKSEQVQHIVTQDVADGDRLGVQGTPTLFINGKRYNGPIQLEALKPLIDAELKNAAPVKVSAVTGTHR